MRRFIDVAAMRMSSATGKHWPLTVLLMAVVALGTRCAWFISRSPTGWRPVVEQWIAAAHSLVGIEKLPLQDQQPADQASFWLDAVLRVPGTANNAKIATGAAWMLDSPQLGWISRHVRLKEGGLFDSLPKKFRRELNQDAITVLVQEFETQCREACLEHIETATQLDSSDVETWRSRALLLFEAKVWGMKLEPRREDWLEILGQCAAHDPDNALYDYLAALVLWKLGTAYDVDGDVWDLQVHDEGKSALATSRLAIGLAKPFVRFVAPRATLQFLEQTALTPSEQLAAAESRQIENRAQILLYSLLRWQNVVMDVEARSGNLEAAATAGRNARAIARQVTEEGNPVDTSTVRLGMQRWSLASLKKLAEDHPTLLSAEDIEQLSDDLAAVRLEFCVQQEACRRLAAKAGVETTSDENLGTRARWSKDLIAMLVMVAVQVLVLATLGLGGAAWLISRVGTPSTDGAVCTLGWFRSIVAWCVGVGLSYGLFGVVPATVSPELWSEARGLHIDADELRSELNLEESRWTWACVYWLANGGPVGAALISVGLLIVWQFMRDARQGGGILHAMCSAKRHHLRIGCETAARSCAVASIVALVVYCSVAPALVPSASDGDQRRRDWLASPVHGWNELANVTAQIRSDEGSMNKLHEQLAAEDRQFADQAAE